MIRFHRNDREVRVKLSMSFSGSFSYLMTLIVVYMNLK